MTTSTPTPTSTSIPITASEIYPGLWLGDINSALNIDFLRDKGITCIINCTASLPFSQSKQIKHRYRVSVRDNLQIDQIYRMYSLLDKAVKIIMNHLPNEKILVHCHAGRQRSVSVLVAFFMKCANISKEDALECIRSKRAVAGYPQFNFDKALIEYENNLRDCGLC